MATNKIERVIHPTSLSKVAVAYNPLAMSLVDLVVAHGTTVLVRLDKEDIGHLINALRVAKKHAQ